MTWRGTTTVRDRIFAALPYLLPLMNGLPFGRFLFQQFPVLQIITLPVIPFAGFIVFIGLYMLVVRNENIPHFIRFNTMQAILIDIVLILCTLVFQVFGSVLLQGFVGETLYNMIFLGLLAVFFYSVIQSLSGKYAEIPTISDAVYMQVR
ncbi:MAG: Tic20 family protein [Planktothrix rubescens PR222]